jgi:AmmeMemoRadiSam system protein B
VRRSSLARAGLLLLAAVCGALNRPAAGAPREAFPAQFRDPSLFARAIADAEKLAPERRVVSGITIPHHLLAADLIAKAFRMVDGHSIDKVVVLFPDHFRRSQRPFATTRRGFETVFGRLGVDQPGVTRLLQMRELVDESDLFGTDHGIGAVLPFVKHHMPSVRIVPIAVRTARKEDWDSLAARLKQIVGPTTLVIQSTDFSHYLPLPEAVQRDQETLNVLAAGRPDAIVGLQQPQHTDSRGAQYLQLRIQREVFRARPVVMFNANSRAFSHEEEARTTSYVVQLYEPRPSPQVGQDAPGSKVYCFGGDTFFGRGILRILTDPPQGEAVLREMQHVLNGCRLVVNLTGVVVPELPVGLDEGTLAMPAALTFEWLRALNVTAVSLANNHAMDLGSAAFDAMEQILTEGGIKVLKQGAIADLGSFRLAAFTDLDNRTGRSSGMIGDDDIARLAHSTARPPLFAMINWGQDYVPTPAPRQRAIVDALRQAAVSLIVGVHPHLAATDFDLLGGGQALSIHSLGNFLFDQSAPRASGSVLEVRMFEQGTFFARLVPIPNFFDSAASAHRPN